MVQRYRPVIILCCCLLILPVFCEGIDEDYFYEPGPALRSKWLEYGICQKPIPNYICRLDCHSNHICIDKQCWCIDKASLALGSEDLNKLLLSKKDPEFESIDLTQGEPEALEDSMAQPSLRHHIAHFCPNLDEARKCIRKCMKQGKPAFCGKDHQCYCGHRYSPHDKNEGDDVKKMYAQFHDLYQKYFGTSGPPNGRI